MKNINVYVALMAVAVLVGPAWASRRAPQSGATMPVQVTVSVSARDGQALSNLTSDNVLVFQDGKRRPVLDWKPVSEAPNGSELGILIDDSLNRELGLNFDEVASFVRSLPASVSTGVAYGSYGSARFTQGFTTDHEKAASALRVTEGRIDQGASIYQSLTDLARHWPADGRPRSVLLVSDGIDYNRGLSESGPTLNPDLDAAIEAAQRAGIVVYSIYAGGSSRLVHQPELVNNGQSSLLRLARESGGEAWFQGTETPITLTPFLNQFRDALAHQYLLTFDATPRQKPGMSQLRVTTELPHLRITAPTAVWLGAAN